MQNNLEKRFFILDNTPITHSTNLFFCNVQKKKRTVNAYSVNLFSNVTNEQFRLNQGNNTDTSYLLLKADIGKKMVKRLGECFDVINYSYIPIKKVETRQYRIYVKCLNGVWYEEGYYPNFCNAIESLLVNEYDYSSFLFEITEEQYKNREEFSKVRRQIMYNRVRNNLLSYSKGFEILNKYFDARDNLFHVRCREKVTDSIIPFDITFDTFSEFYTAVNKDLNGANLVDFDFKDIELNKINFKGAKINSKIEDKIGSYSGSYKKAIFKNYHEECSFLSEEPSLLPVNRENGSIEEYSENDFDSASFYISDIHLNHKLLKKFPDKVNEYEVEQYLRSVVLSLKNSLLDFVTYKTIFIVGDVSFRFDIFKKFFEIYSKEIYTKTFFILGNHELWDKSIIGKTKNLDEMVSIYRNFLASLNITLLQNELYFPNGEKNILNAEQILNMSDKDLRLMFQINPYAYFGSLGYAGLNEIYNYNCGLYRKAHINRTQEIEESKIVSKIHEKLFHAVPDRKIFFITHMPMKDWSNDTYHPGWVYISGHTHHDYFTTEDGLEVYADNQIGYKKMTHSFKYIFNSTNFDYFADYNDGIYPITKRDYLIFNYGIGARGEINRQLDEILLIKRNKCYCFLAKCFGNEKYYLLNGGSLKNVGDHDPQYFYDNLPNYAESVSLFIKDYFSYQKHLANEIKKLGGSGRIHGCIIDLDFYNHIYINPLDGTITPYYAQSIVWKDIYSNFISLVKNRCPSIYKNIKQIASSKDNQLMVIGDDVVESDATIFEPSTEIYKISRIMKSFQFTSKSNVVRIWNDSILADKSKESGKLIVSGIINPDEYKTIMKERKEKEKQKIREESKAKKINEKKNKLSNDKKPRICALDKMKRHQEKLDRIFNGKIKVIKYNGAKQKSDYYCEYCNSNFSYRPDHLLERYSDSCPNCKKK